MKAAPQWLLLLASAAVVFGSVLVLGALPAEAAEYCGQDIDGQVLSATAYSYATSRYYDVSVEFDGTEVIIFFQRGGRLRLALDDEEIDDPHNISAFDYKRGVYWDLDVSDLDDCDDE